MILGGMLDGRGREMERKRERWGGGGTDGVRLNGISRGWHSPYFSLSSHKFAVLNGFVMFQLGQTDKKMLGERKEKRGEYSVRRKECTSRKETD